MIGSESWDTPQTSAHTTETWGSVKLNIDCDVIDGIVASILPPELPFKAYVPVVVTGDTHP